MPKITDDARQKRRRQILDAAWKCFQENGLHATTMQDIIRTSGLSAGAVYIYFQSKDDLIFEAVETSLGSLRVILAGKLAAAPASMGELIADLLPAVVDFSIRDGYDLRRIALLGWAEAQRNERLRSAMQSYYMAFRSDVARVASSWKGVSSPAEGERIAKLLLSVILGTVVQSAILEDISAGEIADAVRVVTASKVSLP